MASFQHLLFPYQRFRDQRGVLGVVQHVGAVQDLLGDIQRVYWLVNDSDQPTVRGGHLHPRGGKAEVMVCLVGEATLEMHSAQGCGALKLVPDGDAALVPHEIWHALNLAPHSVALCIASTLFQPDEAIATKPCTCADSPLP